MEISPNVTSRRILVPHRDEYSETVGFRIEGPNKSAMFIPDIDKWEMWATDIRDVVRSVDYALLDATFFKDGELEGRDMSKIKHPFVSESMDLFELTQRRRESTRDLYSHEPLEPAVDRWQPRTGRSATARLPLATRACAWSFNRFQRCQSPDTRSKVTDPH